MSATIRNAECRLGITCEQSLRHHRTSIHKPDRGDDWALIEEAHFNERNQVDLSIYDCVQRAFEDQVQSLPAVDADSEKQFSGDRYDALLGFVAPPASRSPFELFVKDLPESTSFTLGSKSTALHCCISMSWRKHDANDGRRFLVDWISRAMKKFPHSGDPIPVDANDPLIAARAYTLRLFAPKEQ